MKPNFSFLILMLLGSVWGLPDVAIRACDHCNRHSGSATACDCAAEAACCDDQGILDHSARFLNSLHQKSKRAFRASSHGRRASSCDNCADSACSCDATADHQPSFDRENLLSRLFAKKQGSGCDASPDCGCEKCEIEPSCGSEPVSCDVAARSSEQRCGGLLGKLFAARQSSDCDGGCTGECQSCVSHPPECGVEPECGMETVLHQPCEESMSCDGPSSAGGLLGKLLANRRADGCDTGCTSCAECQPTLQKIPDCGVEQSCDCDSDSCDGASCGGLLGKFLARHQASTCEPCGEVRRGKRIDFEGMFRPSCKPPRPNFIERLLHKHRGIGCDAGCDTTSNCGCGGTSQPVHDHSVHDHSHHYQADPSLVDISPLGEATSPLPSTSIPTMTEPRNGTPSRSQPPQNQTRAPNQTRSQGKPAPSSTPEATGRPAPAPTPPTRVPPRLESQPQPIRKAPAPESQVDPFRDDAARRIRKLPAEPIRYQRNAKPGKPTTSYGTTFDAQASNVRVRFSDYVGAEPERIELTSGSARPISSLSESKSSRGSAGSNSVRSVPAKAQGAMASGNRLRRR